MENALTFGLRDLDLVDVQDINALLRSVAVDKAGFFFGSNYHHQDKTLLEVFHWNEEQGRALEYVFLREGEQVDDFLVAGKHCIALMIESCHQWSQSQIETMFAYLRDPPQSLRTLFFYEVDPSFFSDEICNILRSVPVENFIAEVDVKDDEDHVDELLYALAENNSLKSFFLMNGISECSEEAKQALCQNESITFRLWHFEDGKYNEPQSEDYSGIEEPPEGTFQVFFSQSSEFVQRPPKNLGDAVDTADVMQAMGSGEGRSAASTFTLVVALCMFLFESDVEGSLQDEFLEELESRDLLRIPASLHHDFFVCMAAAAWRNFDDEVKDNALGALCHRICRYNGFSTGLSVYSRPFKSQNFLKYSAATRSEIRHLLLLNKRLQLFPKLVIRRIIEHICTK